MHGTSSRPSKCAARTRPSRLSRRSERRSVCGHFSRTGSADRSTTVRPCPPATAFDFRRHLARGRARASRWGKCWHFYDEDELRRVYYPEAIRLVAEATGASRVLVVDHTIRRRVAGGIDRSPGTPRQPVTSVHNDYTVKSGPQRVRDLMGEEAEELLRHRFEIVNVWRPSPGPLRDAPLAVCDATSVAFTDFVPSDLVYRDRTGEIYRVSYNPAHRWFYVPGMHP